MSGWRRGVAWCGPRGTHCSGVGNPSDFVVRVLRSEPHAWTVFHLFSLVAMAVWIGLSPHVASAGIFGVPTNLDAAGATTATSEDPPGFFLLTGTSDTNDDGDTSHQLRLFIEVTGTTLDVRVFDPGNSGARDLDSTTGRTASTTTFQLLRSDGTVLSQVSNFGNDTGTTDNHLVRFTPNSNGFFALNNGNANNLSFSGLTPGLYEFRVGMGAGTEVNGFGVDVRVSKTDPTHYNAYTIGRTAAPGSAMTCGALNSGSATPYATITQRMVFYPYVTRGCAIETSNFDMDTGTGNPGANSAGDITDTLGAITALTMSGATVHSENSVTVEPTADTNVDADNYGMYFLTNNTGTQQNLVAWRVADFQGWADNPAASQREPVNAIRMYLPNGYDPPIPPAANATAPLEPFLTLSARVFSGTNPPIVGAATRFVVFASVTNPTLLPINGVQIRVGQPATVTYVSGSYEASITDIVSGITSAATCTFTDGSGTRRCDFTSVPAQSIANLVFQVDFAPTANGLQDFTGAPAAGTPPPAAAVWAQYASAFNTTEYLGPICNLRVTVGSGPALPTRASLAGLRVSGSTLEFATGFQRGTVAFNVYGMSRPNLNGPRMLLNESPIPSPVPDSISPIIYRTHLASVAHAYLAIEEIDSSGRHSVMGPFSVADPRLRARFERIEARLATGVREKAGAHMVGQRPHGPTIGRQPSRAIRPWRNVASSHGVKIEVSQPGEVHVSVAGLEAHGVPRGLARHPGRLHVTTQGRSVDFRILADPTGTPATLVFHAPSFSTTFTDHGVYILTWDQDNAPQLLVELTRSDDPKPLGVLRAEENTIYLPSAPQGTDPWLWEMLFQGYPSEPFSFDLPEVQLEARGEASVPVTIRLLGGTDNRHQVEASINGEPVGTLTFQGTGPASLIGRIRASSLRAAGNQLSLRYATLDGPPDAGLAYLNYVDLGVPAGQPSTVIAPEALGPYDPRLPAMEQANYLIITHPLFRDQAEQIADLKRREGLHPVVVDVERAYDHYSAGILEAQAIRALIREVANRSRLRYVLLVGGDTFDYRGDFFEYCRRAIPDCPATDATTVIPSLLGWDDTFGRIPSDNRYADLNDDGAPDLAIGRLPVRTVRDAAILVEKIARQSSVVRANRGRHLLAVGTQGPGDVSFRAEAEAVAGQLPAAAVRWADIDQQGVDAAHTALLTGLRQGALMTHYFGHGAVDYWAAPAFLAVEDVADLTQTSRETILFTWTCFAQWFQNAYGPSINEALLLVERGGALAAFGPAGVTDPALQRSLFDRLYKKLLTDKLSLGEAIRRAKAEAIAENPTLRPVVEGWNLLGDPALRPLE